MHENLFDQLCCVRGFNNMNGKTYNDHIVLILELQGEIKDEVLQAKTPLEAKNILKKHNIMFTHEMNEMNEEKVDT